MHLILYLMASSLLGQIVDLQKLPGSGASTLVLLPPQPLQVRESERCSIIGVDRKVEMRRAQSRPPSAIRPLSVICPSAVRRLSAIRPPNLALNLINSIDFQWNGINIHSVLDSTIGPYPVTF